MARHVEVIHVAARLWIARAVRPLERIRLVRKPARVLVLFHPVPPYDIVNAQAVPVVLGPLLDFVAQRLLRWVCPLTEWRHGEVDRPQHARPAVIRIRIAPYIPPALRLADDPPDLTRPSSRVALPINRHTYSLRQCGRSEEHTSELQSRQYLVCRLLLEKKK